MWITLLGAPSASQIVLLVLTSHPLLICPLPCGIRGVSPRATAIAVSGSRQFTDRLAALAAVGRSPGAHRRPRCRGESPGNRGCGSALSGVSPT